MIRLVAWLVALALFIGCEGAEPDQRARAEELVRAYLGAVRGEADDRGWSLLLEETRATTFGNDKSAYVASAQEADWDDLDWEVGRVVRDEPFTYQVSLQLATGSELPSLVAKVTDFESSPFPPGPSFVVRFHPTFGGDGIWSRNGVDERG